MELTTALIILATGLLAGFINITSAGGSFITIPMLIFLGLPASVANGTNRLAVMFEGMAGMYGFHKNKYSPTKFSLYLGLSATLGAIVGTLVAIYIEDASFKKWLAGFMLLSISTFFVKKRNPDEPERLEKKHILISSIIFFFVGIYGGFIQAGVGFLIMATLGTINKFTLVKANSHKTIVVVMYSIISLALFAFEGKINWVYGIVLAIGNSTGAYFGSHIAVKKGDKWVRFFVIIMMLYMAFKLILIDSNNG